MIEFGSLADWIAAIGGVLAVIAAVVSWRTSEKALEIEHNRDKQIRLAVEREQAELVVVLGVKLTSRGDEECWGIYLQNGSTKPIFDIEIESQKANGHTKLPLLSISSLPPGFFVVPSHPQYHWGSIVSLDLSPEPMEFLLRGKAAKTITKVSFSDAHRVRWELVDGSKLNRVS
ncbi:Uncharacterised protein [Corynebacterium kutscheri]|uniref:Uncharacterized protein n=1 Tax=Corynebacterium kutscheri TaxID=35755 RepID=A0A0F6R0H8_9CORY|nr:hypothetical protein [Corynebacterium kutscheri]AKE41747.1 hypothetical protein UL82_07930 [Corynebacterium kutscheri]VEH09022.1 Uncharacterised protein [Corynebacterium kutscheri]VEH10073.1 Uncharacterised protein [Corynebacterium kutscheri]VEH80155.1 Uncharacterised protein [Corynebacterium kutscheri]